MNKQAIEVVGERLATKPFSITRESGKVFRVTPDSYIIDGRVKLDTWDDSLKQWLGWGDMLVNDFYKSWQSVPESVAKLVNVESPERIKPALVEPSANGTVDDGEWAEDDGDWHEEEEASLQEQLDPWEEEDDTPPPTVLKETPRITQEKLSTDEVEEEPLEDDSDLQTFLEALEDVPVAPVKREEQLTMGGNVFTVPDWENTTIWCLPGVDGNTLQLKALVTVAVPTKPVRDVTEMREMVKRVPDVKGVVPTEQPRKTRPATREAKTNRLKIFEYIADTPRTGAEIMKHFNFSALPGLVKDEGVRDKPRIYRERHEEKRGVVYGLTPLGKKDLREGLVDANAAPASAGRTWQDEV